MSQSNSKKRGLGRGFDALIPTQLVEEEFDPTAARAAGGERVSADSVHQVNPDQIAPNPHQPRLSFDEAALEELAASIRAHGILQPLVVTRSEAGGYQLIAGERRLRAAKLASLATVPVIVRSFNDQQQLELALIENIQRQDLNPIETATAYRKLVDQFNLTNEDIGRRVGKDSSTVSNTMRLLNLPIEAKRAVASGAISEGHARVVLSVPPEKQLVLLEMMIERQWTVRQAEAFARDFRSKAATPGRALEASSQTNELTRQLADYLGTKVSLNRTARGGRLQIEFYSDEELERIYQAIRRQD
ncbi:MAG TPA: ParB/RepB/Spo0J family partition protein [Candidatus Saccharimonadales bacterium]|nr:ParB/RepB/Spo0J family partition protein [Candidatus Saccharimonadales bacterium]